MFVLTGVTKQFGDEAALRDISMTLGRGMNFIIGASGSGKTTLLKILTGMDQSYTGEACYCGQSLKKLTEKEKSNYYHHIFGFVWQDFNLLDDKTVLENVLLPQFLQPTQNKKAAMKLLRELKISQLAEQKAGKLSGGQKQRVAIARELMKNPQVLLADEPTSALDEKSAQAIMGVLRSISKNRTVIVVTHDTGLIDEAAKVYELDKGELIAAPGEVTPVPKAVVGGQPHQLSVKNACRLAVSNAKSSWGRVTATVASLLVAATLLLVTVSGAISGSSQSAFDKLFAEYGQGILDLSVVGSFMSASGTDGQNGDQPNADVTQDINGLYEKYQSDPRVSHMVFSQVFDNIQITADGKDYDIASSGSVPTVNELTAGVMPMGNENQVVVPNSFVRQMGIGDTEALGKTIVFHGAIYNWDSGAPVAVPVRITAKIVGVVDSTVKYDAEGKIMEYTVDDSFFFSKPALDELRKQAKTDGADANFTLRAKTPADLIAIKDELNARGIVPLGRFELVEDMVRLSNQTSQQSGSAVVVIGVLAVAAALSVALMTALSRRREYAIYQVSGFSRSHLAGLTAAEAALSAGVTAVVFLVASPLLNLATTALWNVNILQGKLLLAGVVLVMGTGAASGLVIGLVSHRINAAKALTTGEK